MPAAAARRVKSLGLALVGIGVRVLRRWRCSSCQGLKEPEEPYACCSGTSASCQVAGAGRCVASVMAVLQLSGA